MKVDMGHGANQPKAAPASGAAQDESGFSLVSNRKLHDLYAAMLRMRILAERSLANANSNSTGAEVSVGREAIVAGVTIDLLPSDTVLSSPRNRLPGFLKGVPAPTILSGRGARVAGFPAPAAGYEARFNIAIGAALAAKVQGGNNIAVVFADAQESASATARAALTFAADQELPLIFVCDSMKTTGKSRASTAADRAKACGVPGISVDGNDAVAVYRVAFESFSRARMGRGPTLIECRGFRLQARPGSARAVSRGKAAFLDDSIAQMEKYLVNKGIFRATEKEPICRGFSKQLDRMLAEERLGSAV